VSLPDLSLELDLPAGAAVMCTREPPARTASMICKACGTEIADKALICYRCGASTFEPTQRQRPKRGRPTGVLASLIALVVLIAAALFMARAAVGGVPRTVGVVLLVLAAVALVLQTFARRRRR